MAGGLLATSACGERADSPSSATVYVQKAADGYQLMRKGQAFEIQGVAGQIHLADLAAIGGNTIRTYDTVGLMATLNKADSLDLAVIVGLPLPISTQDYFYKDESQVLAYRRGLEQALRRYADHPALLMWCLGNEPLYYDWFDLRFAEVYNDFLHLIQSRDPNHPVGMGMANFSDRAIVNIGLKIRDLDLLLINTFGRLPQLENDMKPYQWLWDGPILVSEYGEPGPWETKTTEWRAPLELNSTEKAERLRLAYQEQLPFDHPRFIGALAFYWGQRQEQTHTWFNIFSADSLRSASFYALAELWGNAIAGNRPPGVEQLQIDGSRAYNTFLFEPGSRHRAAVQVNDPDRDSVRLEWEILPEDWFFVKSEKPAPVLKSIAPSAPKEARLKFEAPLKTGPYRLFVRALDGQGHFATTNMPFYVVRQ